MDTSNTLPLDKTVEANKTNPISGPLDSVVPGSSLAPKRPDNLDDVVIKDNANETDLQVATRLKGDNNKAVDKAVQDTLSDPSVDVATQADRLKSINNIDNILKIPSIKDMYIEDAVAAQNPFYNKQNAVFARNLAIANEELAQYRKDVSGRGWVHSLLGFIDYNIARGLITTGEQLTDRTSRQGSELFDILTNEDPDAVREALRSKIADSRNEGILFEGSGSALSQFERELYSTGENFDYKADVALGIFDVATGFTAGALLKPTKGLVALKSTAAVVGGVGADVGKTVFEKASAKVRTWGITPATRAGAVGGAEAADKAAEKILKATDDPVTVADVGSTMQGRVTGSVRPNMSVAAENFDKDALKKSIANLEADKGLLTTETLDNARKASDTILAEYSNTYGKSLRSHGVVSVVDEAGLHEGYKFTADIGRVDGLPFSSKATAQKQANILGGTVEEIAPKEFVVRMEQRINTKDGAFVDISSTNPQKRYAAKFAVVRAMDRMLQSSLSSLGALSPLSNTYREVEELSALGLRSQASHRKIIQLVDKRISEIRKATSFDERVHLDAVLTEMSNGIGKETVGWSETAFAAKWSARMGGEIPSQNIINAFHAVADISDTMYRMEARATLQRTIRNGFTQTVELDNGFSTAVKKADHALIKADDKVYDSRTGDFFYWKEIKDEWKGKAIFQMNDEFISSGKTANYVIQPKNIRSVRSSDVLGYAAYGRRTNPEIKHFIFVKTEEGRMKSLLGAKNSKDAMKALEEFKAIQKALKDETLSTSAVDKIIKENSSWLGGIEGKADLDKWMNKNGVNLDMLQKGDIGQYARDQIIRTEAKSAGIFGDGATAAELVNHSMSRSDYVLTEFGGQKAYNLSALSSITDQAASTTKAWAYNYHTITSARSWMESLSKFEKETLGGDLQIVRPAGIDNLDVVRMFENIEVKGNHPFATAFREAQDVFISRRTKMTAFDRMVSASFDLAIERLSEMKGTEWLGKGAKAMFTGIDHKFLKHAYFAAFWGDLSQAFLQSTGMLNSLALAREGVGFRGAASQWTMRKIMALEGNPEKQAILMGRLGKHLGMSDNQMKELVTLWNEHLPHVIMQDHMELGTGLGVESLSTYGGSNLARVRNATSQTFKAAGELGMTPFNWGERNTKSTAFQIAALEYHAINKEASLLSDSARNYIAKRAETLSQNMSVMSRSNIQKGSLAVPTQWMGYFMRTTEQVFLGRDLTEFERMKLFTVVGPMWGLGGVPFFNGVAESVATDLGWNLDDPEDRVKYTFLKYGLFDGIITSAAATAGSDVRTAFAARVALFPSSFRDLKDKFAEDSLLSVLGGPSASIAKNALDAVVSGLGNVYNGRPTAFSEDLITLAKNYKALNNFVTASGILREGEYRNRRGDLVATNMDTYDAVFKFSGFTPTKIVELYDLQDQTYRMDKEFRTISAEVSKEARKAWSIMASDPERGLTLLREVSSMVDVMNVSEQTKWDLRKYLGPLQTDPTERILDTLRRVDGIDRAIFATEQVK